MVVMNEVLEKLPKYNIGDAAIGLESMIDGSRRPVVDRIMSEMQPKLQTKKKKNVSFADQKHKIRNQSAMTNSPSPSRYRMRAVVREEMASSPAKAGNSSANPIKLDQTRKTTSPGKNARPQQSPAGRSTRVATRASTLNGVDASTVDTLGKDVVLATDDSQPKTTTPTVPISAEFNSMNKRLDFDSTESERRRKAAMLAPDAPPFDIGTPPDEEAPEQDPEAIVNGHEGCIKASANKADTSITSVPHEYEKRVVKLGKFETSPYMNYETQKNYNVTKNVEELYSMVCRHGVRSKSSTKDKPIINVDTFFINLGDLADSVAPGKKLKNIVAEIGIHIINEENTNPRKCIMPLCVAIRIDFSHDDIPYLCFF